MNVVVRNQVPVYLPQERLTRGTALGETRWVGSQGTPGTRAISLSNPLADIGKKQVSGPSRVAASVSLRVGSGMKTERCGHARQEPNEQ